MNVLYNPTRFSFNNPYLSQPFMASETSDRKVLLVYVRNVIFVPFPSLRCITSIHCTTSAEVLKCTTRLDLANGAGKIIKLLPKLVDFVMYLSPNRTIFAKRTTRVSNANECPVQLCHYDLGLQDRSTGLINRRRTVSS